MGSERPHAVLFACTMNAVRSPMAAALLRHLAGKAIYVELVGVKAGMLDPLAVEAMDEIGIELAAHKPRRFEELEDTSFDLVVSLSPEAQHRAVELARDRATDIEYWPTRDPSLADGSREAMLAAYREVRDSLATAIRQRFGAPSTFGG